MPSRKRFKPRVIDRALLRKGFKKETSHHIIYYYYINGKKTSIHTYISHDTRELSPKQLNQMAKELKLNYDDFEKLIECPLSEIEYRDYLQSKGYIKGNFSF